MNTSEKLTRETEIAIQAVLFATGLLAAAGRRESSLVSPVRRSATRVTRGLGTAKKRTPAELAALSNELFSAIADTPGESMPVLAERLGVDGRQLERPRILLQNAGRIKTVGRRQSTRYFPLEA